MSLVLPQPPATDIPAWVPPAAPRSRVSSPPRIPAEPPHSPPLTLCILADRDTRPDELPADRVDLLISLGGVSDETVIHFHERLGAPRTCVIRGDGDTARAVPEPFDDLHRELMEVAGLPVVGMGGAVGPGSGTHRYTEDEARAFFDATPSAELVVSHDQPMEGGAGPGGRAGCQALQNYIVRSQPRLVLHGHTGINRVRRMGRAWVVGTCGIRFLTIPRGGGLRIAA